jgi:hypothetical protein
VSDGQRFSEFMRQIEAALKLLPSQVVDLEIGIAGGPDSSWIMYGARELQNISEYASPSRIQNGDVQIRFVRGQALIATMIGRTRVDITPRPVPLTYHPPRKL